MPPPTACSPISTGALPFRPGSRSTRALASASATVRTAAGLVNEEEVRRNLAGTVTSVQSSPAQTLFGYQALAGLDYRLTDALSLGLAARWTRFEKFSKSGGPYDRLRSHASNLRVDGSEPVTWRIATKDIEFVGVNLKLTYEFTGAN